MTQYYNVAVIDSLVWIGAFSARDQYRESSKSILGLVRNGEIKKAYITDYIVIETVNFLLRKEGFNTALLVFELMVKSKNIEIVYGDNLTLDDMYKLFRAYKDLSLTDCSIIALMKEKKIKHLFSFDSGFDKVKDIIRKGDI